MKNCRVVKLNVIEDKRGKMIPLEYSKQLPFDLKRVYYIYDVPENEERGFHSHYELEQILVAVSGSVSIRTKTPSESMVTVLDSPDKGLYIGPMVWREMFDFSPDAVLLVLASEKYNEKDYIRNEDEYLKVAKEYYNE